MSQKGELTNCSVFRTQETQLMALYFRTRQFEKLLVSNFPNKLHKSIADLDRDIEQDLTSILTQRDRTSCPAFVNDNLSGGGCKSRSTYKNQEQNGRQDFRELKVF